MDTLVLINDDDSIKSIIYNYIGEYLFYSELN